jgi:hypothetical protein
MEDWELETRFISDTNSIYKNLNSLTFEQAMERLVTIEGECLLKTETEVIRLEIRRRVLEDAIRIAQSKGEPLERSEEYLAKLNELGFSTPAGRLSFLGAYARECLNAGRPDLVRKHLGEALASVEDTSTEIPPALLASTKELLELAK